MLNFEEDIKLLKNRFLSSNESSPMGLSRTRTVDNQNQRTFNDIDVGNVKDKIGEPFTSPLKNLLSPSSDNPVKEECGDKTIGEISRRVTKHRRIMSSKPSTSSIKGLDKLNVVQAPTLPALPLFSPKKIEECSGMTSYLKPIFDAMKPIVDKHVAMKPILFELVTQFNSNTTLLDLVSHFESLFEAYETFGSVWEGRKFLLRDALVPVANKKRQSELINLSQKFEEVHMISLELFLSEAAARAVLIYHLLTEFKNFTLPFDSGYAELNSLCMKIELIHEKIIARLKKNGPRERSHPARSKLISKEKTYRYLPRPLKIPHQ